jgi:hypothetical protein
MKRLIYLFIFLIFCASVYSSDINILTYREDYRPLETFQAEIIFDKEPINELNNLNFEFYKEGNIGVILNLEKLGNKRYFVYFDIPDVSSGNYKFRVKDINIIENNILKKISEETTINVNSINEGFYYLKSNQNNDGSFSDITRTSLAALALQNVYSKEANLAVSYLLNNRDPVGCYPAGNCNVKDTSFALMALNKFNQNYIKTRNWLKDASNNFDIGTWNLKLEGNANCNNIQVNGANNMNVEDNEINVNCDNNINFILTHSYLGTIYEIYEYSGNNLSYLIDDSGCYGLKYKEKCDYVSTLYASWALNDINENFPEQYLKNNKLDNRTIDHAIGHMLYNDNYDKDWLLNNYLDGYWSYYSASISQQPDNFISALSAYALRNEFVFNEAKKYLESKTKINILDSSLILYLLFNDQVKLPSLSINPGIVNKKNIFILKIKNNNEQINIKIDVPESLNIPSEINLENEVSYTINVKESFDITITYGDYSYNIPVISVDQELNDSLPLLPPPRSAIKFSSEDIKLDLAIDESLTDRLMFTNNWNFKLNEVKLNITGRLKEILKFEQDVFDSIESNQTLSTDIYLNNDKSPQYSLYEGYLIVSSSSGTLDSIKFTINFNPEKKIGNDEKTVDEENIESESQEKNTSTKPETKKKSSLWWLWIIIIAVIGIATFLFFRRKKEITQSFEDYAKKIKR